MMDLGVSSLCAAHFPAVSSAGHDEMVFYGCDDESQFERLEARVADEDLGGRCCAV
jgi:hypothetical protein